MNVDIDPEDVDTYKTDSRGRANLTTEYSNCEVELAILSTDDDSTLTELRDKFEEAYGTRDLDEAKRRAEVHEEWYEERDEDGT